MDSKTMSQPCGILTCEQISRVRCHCCNQNLCLDHLTNHTSEINSQTNSSLSDQVKFLNEQIQRLNIEKIVDNDRMKLDKWRDDSLKKIHRFYDKKLEELEQFYAQKIRQEQKEIDQLQKQVLNLNRSHDNDDVNEFPTTILEIKQKLDTIEQNNTPINIRSLPIDNNLITFGQFQSPEFDIAHLSSPYQTLNISEQSGYAMTSNDQSLLIDHHPDLILYDRNSSVIQQQITWKYGAIRDMCWSLALTSFIIITETNQTYLVHEKNLSVDCIEPMMNQLWMSCTCSNSLLYLVSLSNAIVEFSLLPSLAYQRRWDQPETCEKNESIKDISSNDDTLALIVISYRNQMGHFILRSLVTFEQLYSIRLDMIIHPSYQLPIRCCVFKKHQWLIIETNTSRLFHVGKDGKMKGTLKYDQQPYNAVVVDSHILVIRTERTINFHELGH